MTAQFHLGMRAQQRSSVHDFAAQSITALKAPIAAASLILCGAVLSHWCLRFSPATSSWWLTVP